MARILFIFSLIFATILVVVAVKCNLPKLGKESIIAVSGIFSGVFLIISMVMYFIVWDEMNGY